PDRRRGVAAAGPLPGRARAGPQPIRRRAAHPGVRRPAQWQAWPGLRPRGDGRRGRVPPARAARTDDRGRGHRAPSTLRRPRSRRRRQALRHGRAPCRWTLLGHSRPRAARAGRRVVRGRRGDASRHRAPPGQGDVRAHRGRAQRRSPPRALRAAGRPDPPDPRPPGDARPPGGRRRRVRRTRRWRRAADASRLAAAAAPSPDRRGDDVRSAAAGRLPRFLGSSPLMRRGLLVVISGPSGVGKDTVIQRLLDLDSNLVYSVSGTTRRPRPGEKPDENYTFLSRDEFEKLVAQGAFLEHATYNGNLYGTFRDRVEKTRDQGRDMVLKIDVQGAEQVRRLMPDAILIFVVAPSENELRERQER